MIRPLPMLAKPFTDKVRITPGRYVAEEKYDGRRMVVQVHHQGEGDFPQVTVWSRTGKDGGSTSALVTHKLMQALQKLPNGIYDGELVTRDRSHHYRVADHSNRNELIYVVFDLLRSGGLSDTKDLMGQPYAARRAVLTTHYLEGASKHQEVRDYVQLAESFPLKDNEHLHEIMRTIRARGGEGVIVKSVTAPYAQGKRTDAFLKLKKWEIATLEIVGFERSSGEIVDRGPCAVTLLQDAEGNRCTVKTLDDETCRMIEKHPQAFIGRKLVIEYASRTPSGAYQNPHWDRFEDE